MDDKKVPEAHEEAISRIMGSLLSGISLREWSMNDFKKNPLGYVVSDPRVLFCNVAVGDSECVETLEESRDVIDWSINMFRIDDDGKYQKGYWAGFEPLWYGIAHVYMEVRGYDLPAYLKVSDLLREWEATPRFR